MSFGFFGTDLAWNTREEESIGWETYSLQRFCCRVGAERTVDSYCLEGTASITRDLCGCEAFTGLLILVEYWTSSQEKKPMNKIKPSHF